MEIALKNTSEYVIKVVTCLRLNNFDSFEGGVYAGYSSAACAVETRAVDSLSISIGRSCVRLIGIW